MHTSNKNIIENLKGNNKREALEYLYKKYAGKVKAIVIKAGGSKDDGEDIFQESIMVFYKKVITQELTSENCNIGGFIVGVSKKKWYTKIKQEQTREKYHDKASQHYSKSDSSLDKILNKEREEVITNIFNLLGDSCKELLKMVVYENRKLKEVAQLMGLASESVAKTKHYRCKNRLSSLLKNNKEFKSFLIEHD